MVSNDVPAIQKAVQRLSTPAAGFEILALLVGEFVVAVRL
jgi:hypothetical protein